MGRAEIRCGKTRGIQSGPTRSANHIGPRICGFFLSSIQSLDKDFKGLFDLGDDEGETDEISSRGNLSNFMRHYGWFYQTELVAEYERVTLAEAYEIPALQYLNDLAYLKAKAEHERLEMKKAYGKNG